MKKLILTNEQLKRCLKEQDTTTIQIPAANNDPNTALSRGNVQNQINQAKATFGGNNVTAEITPKTGPGNTTITVPNAGQGISGAADALRNNNVEAQKALNSGMNVGVDVSECKKYTKGQIVEAKIKKMMAESLRLTKKEMQEIAKKKK